MFCSTFSLCCGKQWIIIPYYPLSAFNSFYKLFSIFPIFIYFPYWRILVYSPCRNIPSPSIYLFSDFTVFLWGRITVLYFYSIYLILDHFNNISCHSIFSFDHFWTLKNCLQRTFPKIRFQDHLLYDHLKCSILFLNLWFVSLHYDRYQFAFMKGELYLPLCQADVLFLLDHSASFPCQFQCWLL